MTQDDIIRMAREAGFLEGRPMSRLNHFAALVAAHEREKQAEQKPVAIDWEKAQEVLCDVWNRVISADDGFDAIQDLIYAAPVRTKDLTDDEIASIGSELAAKNCVSDIAFARAVIAKDREKNK